MGSARTRAHCSSDSSRLSERSERSERSEFRDVPMRPSTTGQPAERRPIQHEPPRGCACRDAPIVACLFD